MPPQDIEEHILYDGAQLTSATQLASKFSDPTDTSKEALLQQLSRVWTSHSSWSFAQLIEFVRLKARAYQTETNQKSFISDSDFLKVLKSL